MFDHDALFKWVDNLFFYLVAIVDLDKMVILEDLQFFKLVEIFLLFFVDELYQFQVFDDGHVDEETIEDFLVDFEVVVVDLNHQQTNS